MDLQEYFNFLNALRDTGAVNMFFASPSLMKEFPELDHQEANRVLFAWMDSFKEER